MSMRLPLELDALGDQGRLAGRSPWLTPFALDALSDLLVALGERSHTTAGPKDTPELLVLNLSSLEVDRYGLVPDSACPNCGLHTDDSASVARLELSKRPKQSLDGYRLTPARALVDSHSNKYLNPMCGMLGPHATQDEDHRFNVQVKGRFFEPGPFRFPIDWGGNTNCYRDSLSVGLLEGLERHSGIRPRSRKRSVYDSLRNLGDDALDPSTCGLYEPICHELDSELTPFSPDLKIHWVWGYSLTESRSILVPSQMVYYGNDLPAEPRFVIENSNGCATGSCIEEAILHGILELVERDAFLISWYAKLSLPRIDPWSCRNRHILFLLDRIERMNLDVHIVDLRLDIDIPVVMAFLLRRDGELGALSLAAAAHLDPEAAINSALGEITSYMMNFQQRVQHQEKSLREIEKDFGKLRRLHDHALLYGLPEMAARAGFLAAHPNLRSVQETYRAWDKSRPRNDDLLDDLRFCLERLRGCGLDQVIVVDQTSPEQRRIGATTARTLVPGLVPIDFGYYCRRAASIERMYSVPRALAGVNVDRLNPLPHMFP
jgi:ribosomal protein S12 methylthiotransferase accessory factor